MCQWFDLVQCVKKCFYTKYVQIRDQTYVNYTSRGISVEEKFDTSLSDVKNKFIVCKLINEKLLFTIDRFYKC